MMRPSLFTRTINAALIAVAASSAASCGDIARTGRAPVMLVIDSIEAASGATPDEYTTLLYSDVQTLVEEQVNGQTVRVPTVYSDVGRASFRITLKDPLTPTTPSSINEVTLRRYRVRFVRSDGRNTPGVDVPYGFDGAFTATVTADGGGAGFELVRHSMKYEPPLRNLIGSSSAIFIYTLAEITFYGVDQAGNEVIAVGNLSINFGDWGDPD